MRLFGTRINVKDSGAVDINDWLLNFADLSRGDVIDELFLVYT